MLLPVVNATSSFPGLVTNHGHIENRVTKIGTDKPIGWSENRRHEESLGGHGLGFLLGTRRLRRKEAGHTITAANSQSDAAVLGRDNRALRRHPAGKRQHCNLQLRGGKH
jgi:hypothetical protein